ncbi:MAG: 8-oxo-dGTP diphosphatase [Patescibacteria group bacterium]
MKKQTLLFLRRSKPDELLLAMKKRGFGEGKWNGVGGKVEGEETIEEAVIREAEEEIGVSVLPEDLTPRGILTFQFKGEGGLHIQVHIFETYIWKGEPSESEEMKPVWYRTDSIPYKQMWIDDPHWLPLFLKGKNVRGDFVFDATGKTIISKHIETN